jgi:hypothetical protein
VKPLQRFGKSFVVTRQPTKTSHPGKATLNYPTPGKQHEAPFGFLQLDHTQRYPFLRSRLLRLRACIALIYVCDFDPLVGNSLHRLGELPHLAAFLLVGRGNQQGQQMTQGIHRHVHLAAFTALGPIVACPLPALGAGLQGSCIIDSGAGLSCSTLPQP